MWTIYFIIACVIVLSSANANENTNPQECPEGEIYSTCENAALTCGYRDEGIICSVISRQDCLPGCACDEGRVRNSDHICVERDLCDFDTVRKVRKTCLQHQVYSSCANGICRRQECKEQNRTACPHMAPGTCRPGCVCEPGYLKNSTGHCVTEDQCDDSKLSLSTTTDTPQCPQGEVYSTCANARCRCSRYGGAIVCPQVIECTAGCVCGFGFVSNADGKCITQEQCRSSS